VLLASQSLTSQHKIGSFLVSSILSKGNRKSIKRERENIFSKIGECFIQRKKVGKTSEKRELQKWPNLVLQVEFVLKLSADYASMAEKSLFYIYNVG
jgi:hypothetical protein